jgi:hypothetical protein
LPINDLKIARMKKSLPLYFAVVIVLLFVTCDRDWDNPFHDKNTLDPEAWAPENLQVETVSITERKLTWSYNGHPNIEGFKIDRKKGDEAWQAAFSTLPSETRSWNDTTLIPNGLTYQYRLYAFAGNNSSAEKTTSTEMEFPAPTDLAITKLSEISYKLEWTDNSAGEQGFKIDRRLGDEEWKIAFATLPENTTAFTDTNVFAGKSELNLEYRVYAFYKEFETAKTNANTNAALTPPTDFTITQNTITSVTLNWHYDGAGIDGFKIERRFETGNWFELALTTGTSWQDNDFELNKMFDYRVNAFAGNYASSYVENNFDATIPPPTNLQITKNTITSVTLNWQYGVAGIDGFKIERRFGNGNWDEIAITTGTNWQDNDFELNTMVYYRVYAYVGNYASAYAENNFDATLQPPENLTIIANSATSVTLSWSYNHTGQEGFKIDRKIDYGEWEIGFFVLGAGIETFNDNSVDLWEHSYYYRVYAYVDVFISIEQEVYYNQVQIGSFISGGIVFYLDGYGSGLVCAESDQSTNANWGCNGNSIGGTGTGIGAGAANTIAIVAGCLEAGIAARICNNLVLNGHSDWFLPSKDELNLMYQNLKLNGIGGFVDGFYWSSSENSSGTAWLQNFSIGNQFSYGKFNYTRVRAVRAF